MFTEPLYPGFVLWYHRSKSSVSLLIVENSYLSEKLPLSLTRKTCFKIHVHFC
ncbi:hypothetical protein EXN66_Car001858 [Channa argus]|uniref:Uncharacterized protein n=1 Tax=Channa argus TaxID=215402 RepID=A0A6G1P818_CHAAH|nr:hypothetical protein EXN66_Car001858 [Channa argus]